MNKRPRVVNWRCWVIPAGWSCAIVAAGMAAQPPAQPKPAKAIAPAPGPVVTAGDDLREIPGVRMYSGRVTARPLQAADLQKRGVDPRTAAAAHEAARALLAPIAAGYRTETDEYFLNVPKGMDDADYCRRLMAGAPLQYAEPDWIVFALTAPNDPQFNQQWHHATMQSAQGWDITTGSASVVVAIVDTGCQIDHPDLAPNMVPGAHFVGGATPQGSGGAVTPTGGHGTLTAGSAGARGNNGVGVSGMGWVLSIMPVRCTDADGSANQSDITGGALWAVQHGAKVASCSWSGVESSTVESTGQAIRSAGGVLCYAAGNSSTNLVSFDHPNVVICAASDQSDGRAGFSSFGRAVDVIAPGVGIYTTSVGNGYGGASGTSLSTPLVAGTLGMIWSANPSLTPGQAEAVLKASCDDLGSPGRDLVNGFGRVNLRRAVQMAQAFAGPPLLSDDSIVTFASRSVAIDVLRNDPSGDSGLPISALPSSPLPSGATLARLYGTGPGGRDMAYYAPPAGFTGTDSFTYTVGTGANSAVATVHIDVQPGLFRAASDTYNALEGVPLDMDVLANDGPFPNGLPWILTPNTPTAQGGFVSVVAATSPGARDTLRYIPPAGYTGPDTFTYSLNDPYNLTASARVNVTVAGAGPTPQDDAALTAQGVPVTIDVLANDTHPANRPMTIDSFAAAAPSGAVISRIAGAGPGGRDVLRYEPAPGFVGGESFAYTVRDSAGQTAPATVTVSVEPIELYRQPQPFFFADAGVRADYYALSNPSVLPEFQSLTPVLRVLYGTIDFPSTNGAFGGTGFADDFGVVFTGSVVVPATANYTFFTNSDDGSRLLIGEDLVVSNDGLHGMVERSGAIRLQAGRHPWRVEFFEHLIGAGVQVSIEGGGLSKQIVPASMLLHQRPAADLVASGSGLPPGDGFVSGADFDYFVQAYFLGLPAADVAQAGTGLPGPDGFLTGEDFDFFVQAYFTGQ